MRILYLAMLSLCLAACSHNQPSTVPADTSSAKIFPMATAGFVFKEIPVFDAGPGGTRPYAVYVPPGYDPSKPTPTILFLHGRGESGTDGRKQTTVGLGSAIELDPEAWPFIVIFPQKPTAESQWIDHQQLVLDIVDRCRTEYNIDSERLYLTGLSQGGAGTWALGARFPERWAALVPICGYYRNMGDAIFPQAIAIRVKQLPIWAFHGLKDDIVPPEQTTAIVTAIQQRQIGLENVSLVKITLLPDANHNSWDPAYRNYQLGNWLLGHSRRTMPPAR